MGAARIGSGTAAGRAEGHYSVLHRVLHWTIAALVVAQIAIVWSIPADDKGDSPLWWWHASIGPTILALMIVRLGVRATSRIPPLPDDLVTWKRVLARTTQWTLYALLILMPLTGWAIFSVYGNGPDVWGLIQLPPIVTPAPEGANAEALAAPYAAAHGAIASLLLLFVALHVAGALHHLLLRRDGVFASMTAGGGGRR